MKKKLLAPILVSLYIIFSILIFIKMYMTPNIDDQEFKLYNTIIIMYLPAYLIVCNLILIIFRKTQNGHNVSNIYLYTLLVPTLLTASFLLNGYLFNLEGFLLNAKHLFMYIPLIISVLLASIFARKIYITRYMPIINLVYNLLIWVILFTMLFAFTFTPAV